MGLLSSKEIVDLTFIYYNANRLKDKPQMKAIGAIFKAATLEMLRPKTLCDTHCAKITRFNLILNA